MKTTTHIIILATTFFLQIGISQAQNQDVQMQDKNTKITTITQQSGYVTKEEIPPAVLPVALIDKVAQTYSKPTFGRAYQLVRSDEIVGFEVEFMDGNKFKVLQYKLQNDEKELHLLGKDGE